MPVLSGMVDKCRTVLNQMRRTFHSRLGSQKVSVSIGASVPTHIIHPVGLYPGPKGTLGTAEWTEGEKQGSSTSTGPCKRYLLSKLHAHLLAKYPRGFQSERASKEIGGGRTGPPSAIAYSG